MHDFSGGDRGANFPDDAEDYGVDAPPAVGSDERRMHVRAYNHWVSLLDGRPYPSVEDIEPEDLADFGPHSVLLDFTQGAHDPAITFLGETLREECGFETAPTTVAEVPPRSLLSRLTDHYLQIIANRAPIGFEAEFVNTRGQEALYRGILLPLSSDGDTIDFIYGVINWKTVVSGDAADALTAEVAESLAKLPPRPTVPVWADGPSGVQRAPARPIAVPAPVVQERDEEDAPETPDTPDENAGLADWLASARASAEAMQRADSRSRAALYSALGAAYDFALRTETDAEDYAALLEDSGIVAQARAPMTPVVKLVFGAGYDKTRLTEFAAALSYAKRHGLPLGGMRAFLDHYPGGLKAIVAADRRERRPEGKTLPADEAREAARKLVAQAVLALPGEDEFVVLVARRLDPDHVAVIGVVPEDKSFTERAIRAVAR